MKNRKIFSAILLICLCALALVIIMPMAHATGGIAFVQGNIRGTTTTATNPTVSLTWSNTPASGDVIFLTVGYAGYSGDSLTISSSSITETGVTWYSVTSSPLTKGGGWMAMQAFIFIGIVGSGAGKSLSVACIGNANYGTVADAVEYSGVATSSYTDTSPASSSTTGSTSTVDSGTTTATTQNDVCIAAIVSCLDNGLKSPTNGFTMYDGAWFNGDFSFGMFAYIQSTTATANVQASTNSADNGYSGCIETFLPSAPSPTATPTPTPAPGGWSHDLMGVPNANINSVGGVPKAQIQSIGGVP